MTKKSDKWVIIGKPECPWCDKAKALLEAHDIKYIYKGVYSQPELHQFLLDCGLNTVPQVYINGQRLGGYTELSQYINIIHPKKDTRQLESQV